MMTCHDHVRYTLHISRSQYLQLMHGLQQARAMQHAYAAQRLAVLATDERWTSTVTLIFVRIGLTVHLMHA